MAILEVRMLDDMGAVLHVAAAQVPDTVPPRFFAAYKRLYGQVPAGPPDSETGAVIMRDMTDAELWGAFADGLIRGVIANVVSEEKAQAAAEPAAAPAPIEFVPLTGEVK